MKKTIAMILSVLMLLSIIPMAGAASFNDSADVTMMNSEAVDILSDLKVITGFPEGTFKPNDTLTRAQAAKILCCVVLGTNGADALAGGGSTFNDVPASHWSNKYVEYCASKGIVAGTGAGKFNPNGKLTGYAFGKMLLVALGADGSSLTGANWDKNTKAPLQEKHLNYGVDVSNNEISRQDACRLALNAMFNGEGADPEGTLAFKAFGVMRAAAGNDGKHYKRPVRNYIATDADVYWTGSEKKVVASPDWFKKSGSVKGGDVVKELGVTDIDPAQMKIFRNGAAAGKIPEKNDNLHEGKTGAYYCSGAGVQLEFYYAPDTDIWTVIHLFYFSEKVASVNEPRFYADGSVEVEGSVTFENGWTCASNAFKQSDVGNYALIHGMGKKTMNVIESAVEAWPGTVVEGPLTVYDKNGLTVGGRSFKFASQLGTASQAKKYIDNGGALGDTVKVLISDDGLVINVWQ